MAKTTPNSPSIPTQGQPVKQPLPKQAPRPGAGGTIQGGIAPSDKKGWG